MDLRFQAFADSPERCENEPTGRKTPANSPRQTCSGHARGGVCLLATNALRFVSNQQLGLLDVNYTNPANQSSFFDDDEKLRGRRFVRCALLGVCLSRNGGSSRAAPTASGRTGAGPPAGSFLDFGSRALDCCPGLVELAEVGGIPAATSRNRRDPPVEPEGPHLSRTAS